jgi:DUF971 family protein
MTEGGTSQARTDQGGQTVRVFPAELRIVDDSVLQIIWSDGRKRRYTFRELRDRCPCAVCQVERDEKARNAQATPLLPVLKPTELRPLRIERMTPVGTYAYSIAFSDGHRTGIYTFELLRELGQDDVP